MIVARVKLFVAEGVLSQWVHPSLKQCVVLVLQWRCPSYLANIDTSACRKGRSRSIFHHQTRSNAELRGLSECVFIRIEAKHAYALAQGCLSSER